MTVRRFILAAALSLVAGFGSASARDSDLDPMHDSVEMLAACEQMTHYEAGPVPKGGDVCLGFMGAFSQIARLVHPGTTARIINICTPPDTAPGQMIQVFTKFARDHPELLNQPTAEVALRAFQAAFPCTSQKQ